MPYLLIDISYRARSSLFTFGILYDHGAGWSDSDSATLEFTGHLGENKNIRSTSYFISITLFQEGQGPCNIWFWLMYNLIKFRLFLNRPNSFLYLYVMFCVLANATVK